jgi:aspartate racemase
MVDGHEAIGHHWRSRARIHHRLLPVDHQARPRAVWGVAPPVLINSIDVGTVLRLVEGNALTALADYLVVEIEALARADASLALIAANTPHIVFDEVRARSPIPLVSIVEATREAAQQCGLNRLALFGTKFTMLGRFYPDVFSRSGIELVRPRDDELSFIHEAYVGELLQNVFRPETRDRFLAMVQALKDRDRAQAVILAGTELPLLLTKESTSALPLLDTTEIHVMAAIHQLWG